MDYKRLELYVGWTCNQKCNYCMEFPTMELKWKQKVTKLSLLKKLVLYKKKGYNHVTYLGGEPFIQEVFHDALLLAKKLEYTTLVTTNATTLHIEKQAKKFLPYIDELILSVEGIGKDVQQKISRTQVEVHWDKVFDNISTYWKGTFLKANIVIVQDNIDILYDIVEYLVIKGVREISITYPDLDLNYYSESHTKKYIAPKYDKCMKQLMIIMDTFYKKDKVIIKIVDFPFCVFPEEVRKQWITLTDDSNYENRVKSSDLEIGNNLYSGERNRETDNPRERYHTNICSECRYKDTCWGVAIDYITLYGLSEIQAIK